MFTVEEIEMVNGRKYLMYDGYTFCFKAKSRHGETWRCTRTQDCRATIKLHNNGSFREETGLHCHDPPSLHVIEDGRYLKLGHLIFVDDATIIKRKTERRLYTAEILNNYNLATLVRKISTREQGVAFAEEHGLILKTKLCSYHRRPMKVTMYGNKVLGNFVCKKRNCRKSVISRGLDTWFEHSRLGLPKSYYLVYCFAHRWPYKQVIHEDIDRSQNTCISEKTISDWYNSCREAVVLYQLDKQEFRDKIGGPGKIVQIDECQFGKRKCLKGQQIEGHWIFGFIENGSDDLTIEVCLDNNVESAEVLVPLVKKHVHEGTTIYTNSWRAYDCLGDHGFVHKKINDIDPENPSVANEGTRTQKTKSQWRVVKRFFNKDNESESFCNFIMEYFWRRSVEKYREDPFAEMLKVIKYVYDPSQPAQRNFVK